jgi:hypothetical protein
MKHYVQIIAVLMIGLSGVIATVAIVMLITRGKEVPAILPATAGAALGSLITYLAKSNGSPPEGGSDVSVTLPPVNIR